MGRQFAYIGNDKSLLPLALEKVGMSLSVDDGECNGWGLGYFDDDRALVRKRPVVLSGRIDLRDLCTDVVSKSVLAHVRQGTTAPTKPANTQPFRFRTWLFAHTGLAAESETIREALRDSLPDFVRRNVRGETDSEPALHLFFAHLRSLASLDRAIVPVGALFTAIRKTLEDLDRLHRENEADQPPTVDMLFTSGRMIVAANQSPSRLAWMRIDGLEEVESPLFAGHEPRTTQHPHYKGVFVTFDPHGSDGDWNFVDDDHLLVVDEQYDIHVEPIEGTATPDEDADETA